jgi:hypothetical protein
MVRRKENFQSNYVSMLSEASIAAKQPLYELGFHVVSIFHNPSIFIHSGENRKSLTIQNTGESEWNSPRID